MSISSDPLTKWKKLTIASSYELGRALRMLTAVEVLGAYFQLRHPLLELRQPLLGLCLERVEFLHLLAENEELGFHVCVVVDGHVVCALCADLRNGGLANKGGLTRD